MKLYATTTSERASKGQGGNEYLKIELKGEDRDRVYATLWLHNDGQLELFNSSNKRVYHVNAVEFQELKANKKKDEVCEDCGTTTAY